MSVPGIDLAQLVAMGLISDEEAAHVASLRESSPFPTPHPIDVAIADVAAVRESEGSAAASARAKAWARGAVDLYSSVPGPVVGLAEFIPSTNRDPGDEA